MREIKFRAWDKTQGVMIENVKIDEIGHACWYSGSVCQVSPFVMQFTGLKDKNGKEIYEGDIVNTIFKRVDGKQKEEIRVVSWDDCNPCFVLNTVPFKAGFGEYDFIQCGLRTNEVIGNIYENPELLTPANHE